MSLMTEPEDHPRTSCQRCGTTCCRKGRPAHHLEDKACCWADGAIPLTALYTLRKGELARDDNYQGRPGPSF
ncbi:MAG: hypothetical protein R2860_02065 [Desulfobacterales bacterium]